MCWKRKIRKQKKSKRPRNSLCVCYVKHLNMLTCVYKKKREKIIQTNREKRPEHTHLLIATVCWKNALHLMVVVIWFIIFFPYFVSYKTATVLRRYVDWKNSPFEGMHPILHVSSCYMLYECVYSLNFTIIIFQIVTCSWRSALNIHMRSDVNKNMHLIIYRGQFNLI